MAGSARCVFLFLRPMGKLRGKIHVQELQMATEFNMESSASFLMVTFHGCNLSLSLFGHRLRSGVDSRAAAERIKFVIRAAFALYSLPHPPALCGGMGTFFCGALQAGRARLQSPLIFSPSPAFRWGGGRGRGESCGSQRFVHCRLDSWRQAEQLRGLKDYGREQYSVGGRGQNRQD